jgi:hypothetical protein
MELDWNGSENIVHQLSSVFCCETKGAAFASGLSSVFCCETKGAAFASGLSSVFCCETKEADFASGLRSVILHGWYIVRVGRQ